MLYEQAARQIISIILKKFPSVDLLKAIVVLINEILQEKDIEQEVRRSTKRKIDEI